MSETQIDLVDFLLKEMGEQELAPVDITKRTGLSASQVSKILNRESPAGTRAIECFAQALNLPVETLYRYAGKFGKYSNPTQQDEKRKELLHIAENLSEDYLEDTVDYARMKYEKQKREEKDGKRDRTTHRV